jgi:hypothetical protein
MFRSSLERLLSGRESIGFEDCQDGPDKGQIEAVLQFLPQQMDTLRSRDVSQRGKSWLGARCGNQLGLCRLDGARHGAIPFLAAARGLCGFRHGD